MSNRASSGEASDVGKLRILLVEDNPVNQLVAEELLIDEGYVVEVAENGQVALERLGQPGIDLVLMDCQMPILDGFEATRRYRLIEAQCGIADEDRMPIIALTANAVAGDRERCTDSGMSDYMTKPIDTNLLKSLIDLHTGSGEQEFLATGT